MLITLISIILGLMIALTGLLILLRNNKSRINQLFFVICFLSACWSINFANITRPYNIDVVVFLNSLSYVLGLLLLFSVVLFTYYFPRERKKRFLLVFTCLTAPVITLSMTPLIGGTVTRGEDGAYVFAGGPLSILYLVVMFLGVCLIAYNLFSSRKSFSPVERAQMQLVAFGFVLSFIVGVGLSTVLPLIYPTSKFDNFAPFSLVFLLGFSAAAVTRYKMFDFRAIAVRAAGYIIMALGVAFLLSFLLLSVVNDFLFVNNPVSTGQKIFYSVMLTIVILAYPYVQEGYNKLSRKLFFRSSYDPREVLYDYNARIVESIDTKRLSATFTKTIIDTVSATKVLVYLEDVGVVNQTANPQEVSAQELEAVTALYKKNSNLLSGQTLSMELLDKTEGLLDELKGMQYSLVVPIGSGREISGFALIGQKKTGTLFSSGDINLIDILADQLALALNNAMQYEEIAAFNKTLTDKIEEATKELRRTNEKLKALDEAKDEFISMASHQLRTPLTSVKGYISMILDGDVGQVSPQQKQMLDQAFISSQRMVYLIADLLNVSRLRTGKFVIELTPTYLPDVVEGEISQLKETAKAKGLELSFDKPTAFPTMNLDETKIRQVIMNFTDNAVYYTRNGGHIKVALASTDQSVTFTVTDDGIGVPKSERHHLFAKFYRAGNARKARPDGTGLGLFMAKKVVVAQGGAIIFESTEGKGSTFGFTFPRARIESSPAGAKSGPVGMSKAANVADKDDEKFMKDSETGGEVTTKETVAQAAE